MGARVPVCSHLLLRIDGAELLSAQFFLDWTANYRLLSRLGVDPNASNGDRGKKESKSKRDIVASAST